MRDVPSAAGKGSTGSKSQHCVGHEPGQPLSLTFRNHDHWHYLKVRLPKLTVLLADCFPPIAQQKARGYVLGKREGPTWGRLQAATTGRPHGSGVIVMLLAHRSHSQKYSLAATLVLKSATGQNRTDVDSTEGGGGSKRKSFPPLRVRNNVPQDGFAHFATISRKSRITKTCNCSLWRIYLSRHWTRQLVHLTVPSTMFATLIPLAPL
jgi:hypothetical protein